jgi:hypothetical protein
MVPRIRGPSFQLLDLSIVSLMDTPAFPMELLEDMVRPVTQVAWLVDAGHYQSSSKLGEAFGMTAHLRRRWSQIFLFSLLRYPLICESTAIISRFRASHQRESRYPIS